MDTLELPVDRPLDQDEASVRRAKARDAGAWSDWYQRYYPTLYRYALVRVGRREEAEDVASQVFLEALKSIDRYRYRGRPILAWFYSIARNLVAARHRRARRGTKALTHLKTADLWDPGPEAAIPNLDLRQAMDRLKGEQREVLILRFFLSLSTKEVAALLGKSEGAVYSLQVRAVASLRRYLSAQESGGPTE